MSWFSLKQFINLLLLSWSDSINDDFTLFCSNTHQESTLGLLISDGSCFLYFDFIEINNVDASWE
jgi:hypothetical protein